MRQRYFTLDSPFCCSSAIYASGMSRMTQRAALQQSVVAVLIATTANFSASSAWLFLQQFSFRSQVDKRSLNCVQSTQMGNQGSFLNASGPVEALSYDPVTSIVYAATPLGVDFFNAKVNTDQPSRSWKFASRALGVLFTQPVGFVVSGEQDGCTRFYKAFAMLSRRFYSYILFSWIPVNAFNLFPEHLLAMPHRSVWFTQQAKNC